MRPARGAFEFIYRKRSDDVYCPSGRQFYLYQLDMSQLASPVEMLPVRLSGFNSE